MHTHQNLEARVGIGRLMPVFRPKTTISAEQFQFTLPLFGLTGFNSLTKDFTEGSTACVSLTSTQTVRSTSISVQRSRRTSTQRIICQRFSFSRRPGR